VKIVHSICIMYSFESRRVSKVWVVLGHIKFSTNKCFRHCLLPSLNLLPNYNHRSAILLFSVYFQWCLGDGQRPAEPSALRGQGSRAQQAGRDRGTLLRLRRGQVRGHLRRTLVRRNSSQELSNQSMASPLLRHHWSISQCRLQVRI